MTQRRTTPRAVLYARKSNKAEIQTSGYSKSVTNQFTDMRAYAERTGMNVVAEEVDDAVSGKHQANRPGLQRVLGHLDADDADIVVVDAKDRLGRNVGEYDLTMSDFDQRGIAVHSVTQGGFIDRSTAHGHFVDTMDAALADRYWRERSEGWRKALARRHNDGLPKNGLLRYGYASPGRGLPLVPDPATAPILRELYLRYAAGAGFQALVQDLNARGITTRKGREWGTHSLIRMLDSGFGAGLLINGRAPKETYSPGVHEPVIKPEEWQAYLDARAARRQLPTKRRTPRWALSGIARCGLCGSPLNVSTYNEPKSQVRCTSYVNSRTCTGVWMNRRALDNLVEMWLVGWHADDMAAVLSAERTEQAARARSQAEHLEEALTAAQTALGNLAVRFSQDLIDTEAHALAQVTLVQDRDRLAQELTDARNEVTRLGPVTDPLENPGDLTPGEWGQAVGRVLRRVEVTKHLVRMVPVVGEPQEFDR